MAYDPQLEAAILASSLNIGNCYENVIGFQNNYTTADGNCLFHAIGSQILPNQSHDIVRRDICDWFQQNILNITPVTTIIIKKIIQGNPIFDELLDTLDVAPIADLMIDERVISYILEYIQLMRTERTVWGGEPEIIAATQLYQRTIVVFIGKNNNYHYYVHKYDNSYNNPIYLYNCKLEKTGQTNHYISLTPTGAHPNFNNVDEGNWPILAANSGRPGSIPAAVAGLANLSSLGKSPEYCIYRNEQQYCYPPQVRETIDFGYTFKQPVKFDIKINGQNEHHEITFGSKVKKGQYTLYRVEK